MGANVTRQVECLMSVVTHAGVFDLGVYTHIAEQRSFREISYRN